MKKLLAQIKETEFQKQCSSSIVYDNINWRSAVDSDFAEKILFAEEWCYIAKLYSNGDFVLHVFCQETRFLSIDMKNSNVGQYLKHFGDVTVNSGVSTINNACSYRLYHMRNIFLPR
jgi:hypothetical protein